MSGNGHFLLELAFYFVGDLSWSAWLDLCSLLCDLSLKGCYAWGFRLTAVNVFLAAFKAVIGIASGSIAITLDAVNNLCDALSSLITILATKLSGKRPDREHPYGYGRIEYLSTMVISVIILYAGVTSLIESIKKIIFSGEPEYSAISLLIIASAVIVKIMLGKYVERTGKKVGSLHVEVPDSYTVYQLDKLERTIAEQVYTEHNVILAAVGVYAMNTEDDFAAEVLQQIRRITGNYENVLQVHGFYLHEEEKKIGLILLLTSSRQTV